MIRVIIKREIAQGLEEFYESAIANLLDVMANASGYVSGESAVEIHRPNRYFVITRWTSEAAWNQWCQSSERQELLNVIRPFLMTEEKFTLLRQLKFHRDQSVA
jgi:heme-degrading monooxygenase HmoA